MRKISRSKQFKKDLKNHIAKMTDKHFNMLIEAIYILSNGGRELPPIYKEYTLKGRLKDYSEFHIGGNLLVIYRVEDEILYLIRLGTHSEILGM